MPNYSVTIEQIDALLPQTQCGECSYAGCLPYAKAIVNHDESIDRCPPGGVATLKKLATVMQIDPQPLLEAMIAKEKSPTLAIIDESICIGCTKCIKACPVDAIIGAAKQMHNILTDECTGCGLCIAPCPVDCIELKPIAVTAYSPDKARQRFNAKQNRSKIHNTKKINAPENKKSAILAAVARAKTKKQINHE
jgi:electron transport complex protein RnfB